MFLLVTGKVAENSRFASDLAIFQAKITKAMRSGNQQEMAKVMVNYADIQKQQKEVLKNSLTTTLVQGPIFISMYQVLRAMANYPVVSMETGGLFWFTNFTQTDPFYILPL